MRNLRLASTFLVALALLATAAARATTVTLTLDEIVAQSDMVARVTVVESSTRWVGRRIVTFHELHVDDVLRTNHRGVTPRTVTLALPGGVVDGVGQRVAGAPDLRTGASYVLCLSRDVAVGPDARARALVGLWRGAWIVQVDRTLAPFAHDVTAPPSTTIDALRDRVRAIEVRR